VYWCGLAEADDAFVHSRIDCVTRSSSGNVDVWEFKTKWSTKAKGHFKQPLLRDLRQVVLYAYMFRLQTRLQIDHVHVRYATADPQGKVTLTTHTNRFDGAKFGWAVADALKGTTAYADARLATYDIDGLIEAMTRRDKTMPSYQILQLVRAGPLVDPRASAQLPAARPPWVMRLGALWIPAAPTTTVYGDGIGDNGHKRLDTRVKEAGTDLVRLMERRRCFGKVAVRLDRLYGPAAAHSPEGRRRDTAEAVVIRTLNRGINALVGKDARDAQPGFAHSSNRPEWSREAIDAAHGHLPTVVGQVEHDMRRACRR